MTRQELYDLAEGCYPILGATQPKQDNPAWSIWAEMCRNIPATPDSARYIISKFGDLDAMPRNFGKAVRQYGQEWASERGMSTATSRCPDCDFDCPPGRYTAWFLDQRTRKYRSGIAYCSCFPYAVSETIFHGSKADARIAGFVTRPQKSREMWMKFEDNLNGISQDTGFYSTKYLYSAMRAGNGMRDDHRAILAEMEIAQ